MGVLPAAAALLVLVLAGPAGGPATLAMAALAAASVAIAIALLRLRRSQRVEDWLAGLARNDATRHPAGLDEPTAAGIVRPVIDLLRRLRREERDNAARQKLVEQLVEALPDPILMIDERRRVVQANAAARRGFEIAALPMPLGRVLRDPGVLAAVDSALDGDTTSELAFRPALAPDKQFAVRALGVVLPRGAHGALLALREETEQVMIERMRSDFVANASHEIRNPLAALVGFIETLQGPARDDAEARAAFLAIMAEETARMTRLVDDLLSLSRIELAADQPPAETIDILAILAPVIDRLEPRAAQQGVTIERTATDRLPRVQGTPDQLHQLFTNLIDNAIKYGGANRTVTVEARVLDPAPVSAGALAGRRALAVSVADQGQGIGPEHIPRLTERFYRVDRARSRSAGGTGLGLAIVKHIVRHHRGELRIESELGRGSRFTVLLPVPGASDGSAASPPGDRHEAVTKSS
jgi:two-component system phosphate regulon sensor histidine kinase PhoR